MPGTVQSYCRICNFGCAIDVEVEEGRALSVTGDRADPVFHGYTCVKGRAQAEFLNSGDRLLHASKRRADGSYVRIGVDDALGEIAETVRRLLDRHGPRCVATYLGTMSYHAPATQPFAAAFMDAIGSPMRFTPETIDKPGKAMAKVVLGTWMAPPHGFHDPDVALYIGLNPLVGYQGVPSSHPGRWLNGSIERGMKLIVIDPRRTETAKRAHVHLQARPGHDAEILAAMLRVLFDEGLGDPAFVASEVTGAADLERAVAPFAPDLVAARAGIAVEDLVLAARIFGRGRRGYVCPGTGPNMSTPGVLVEYLAICLDTLCGHWMRAGERVENPGVLDPLVQPVAQAAAPSAAYGIGELMRGRGVSSSVAGMPTAALSDEMLVDDPGRVRALLSVGGNPVAAWPNESKTRRALAGLDLFVQVDPWMSASARVADYVIAPKMPLEVPSMTILIEEKRKRARGSGILVPYGRYTPAVCDAPPGSELVQEWEIFYGLLRLLGHERVMLPRGSGRPAADLDLTVKPTDDELFDLLTEGSRIPLDELRRNPGRRVYDDVDVVVAAKDPGWPHRLDVADADMLADLAVVAGRLHDPPDDDLRLVCRRMQHVYNSSCNHPATNHGRSFNPAFMHEDDLARLGLESGDRIRLASAVDDIPAIAIADNTLRPGVVSMSFGFGGTDRPLDAGGSSTARLVDDTSFDRYAGMPPLSNIRVRVRPDPLSPPVDRQ